MIRYLLLGAAFVPLRCAPSSEEAISTPRPFRSGATDLGGGAASRNTPLGVDGDTGKDIYTGGTCDSVRQWTSPIAVNGRIIAGGDGHLCAWKLP